MASRVAFVHRHRLRAHYVECAPCALDVTCIEKARVFAQSTQERSRTALSLARDKPAQRLLCKQASCLRPLFAPGFDGSPQDFRAGKASPTSARQQLTSVSTLHDTAQLPELHRRATTSNKTGGLNAQQLASVGWRRPLLVALPPQETTEFNLGFAKTASVYFTL